MHAFDSVALDTMPTHAVVAARRTDPFKAATEPQQRVSLLEQQLSIRAFTRRRTIRQAFAPTTTTERRSEALSCCFCAHMQVRLPTPLDRARLHDTPVAQRRPVRQLGGRQCTWFGAQHKGDSALLVDRCTEKMPCTERPVLLIPSSAM